MAITSFTGEQLLDKSIIAQIKKESDLLLADKDVAESYFAASHLKRELARLPPEKVQAVLNDYRPITTSLKVLALPLLSREELKNILQSNLPFLLSQLIKSIAPFFSPDVIFDKSKKSANLLGALSTNEQQGG